MRWLFGVFALLLVAGLSVLPKPANADETDQKLNLIRNGLFERFVTYDDITVGENWASWTILGRPKFNVHGHEPGQQIMSERAAFISGIYQEISNVKPGAQYYGYVGTASLYWGNTEGKLEEVCRSVGIDPTGGTNPQSPEIVWGNVTCANKRWEWKDDPNANGPKVRAIAKGPKITFFIKVEFLRGDNLAQAWFQDAAVFLETETPSGVPTPVPNIYNRPGGGAPVNSPATPGPSVPNAPTVPSVAPGAPPVVPPSSAIRPEADYALGGQAQGRFYTQTAKNGQGYRVADQGTDKDGNSTRWWSEFTRLGGIDALGYPISKPYTGGDGFLYQAFQRGVLQWRPELKGVVLANTFDALSAANRDEWLAERAIPKPVKDDGSNGDYAKAVQIRLGYLTNPEIARRFREGPDPAGNPRWSVEDSIALYGLPTSEPVKSGPFIVQRFQRVAFQLWVEDAPNSPAKGSVVPVLGGDLYAEAGLVPADARVPENAP